MLLPTTADADPNMLVVLVIKHQNLSNTQGILGIQKNFADQNGNSINFFELAM